MSFLDQTGLGTFWAKLKNYFTHKEEYAPENVLYNSNFVISDYDENLASLYGTPANYTANKNVMFSNNWFLYCTSDMTEFSINRYNYTSGAVRVTGIPSSDGAVHIRPYGTFLFIKIGTEFTAGYDVTCLTGSASITLVSAIQPSSNNTVYSSGDITMQGNGETKSVFQAGSTNVSNAGIDVVINYSAGSKIDFYVWNVYVYPCILNYLPKIISKSTYYSPHCFRELNCSAWDGYAYRNYVHAIKSNTNTVNELYKYTFIFNHTNFKTTTKRIYLVRRPTTAQLGNGSLYTLTGRITITSQHSNFVYDALFTVPISGRGQNLNMDISPIITVLAKANAPSGWTEPTFNITNSSEKAIYIDSHPVSTTQYDANIVLEYTITDTYTRLFNGGFFKIPEIVDITA